ncbi:MAG: ubiquinone biosynthesis protein [Alphaproteobacteria bacterium]|nr:ubiquinone biosynthesis protein [Alphaproteobacteria bacterium]
MLTIYNFDSSVSSKLFANPLWCRFIEPRSKEGEQIMQGQTQQSANAPRIQPLVALRALRAIFRDKEDTGQVFRIVNALTGKSLIKRLDRFRNVPVGRQILAENRQLLSTLSDRKYLASLPEGSYGRAYLKFLETEGLSAEGLIEASKEAPRTQQQADYELFTSRLRDSHDLQHVLTGYGRNTLGELSVLAFSYAHTRNPGIGFLVITGMFKFRKEMPKGIPVFRAVWEAYRNGVKSAWLPAADWEALLKLPMAEARRVLNIAEPVIYKGVEPRMKEAEAEYQRMRAGHSPQPA